LSVAQNLATTDVARKSGYAIFYPKIRFSTSLHLKTPEKHSKNPKKLTLQLKKTLNFV